MSLRLRLTKRNSRGQSLVETALILPIIVLLLLLGIDLGRVFFTSIDLRNAAHEATMLGGTVPDATCGELKATIDRQMGRTGQPNAAVCGPLGTTADVVFIIIPETGCERIDPGPACSPDFDANAPYPADSDLRYRVHLEYRFQPVVPLVGFLTGNGMGGSLTIRVENRSPVLVGYEGS
jgi:hypothetical protein